MVVPARIPRFIQLFFRQRIWQIKTNRRELFLTFDDGPDPRITPMVLDLLKKHDAKATFFCIGDRVARYPEVYTRIIDEGHAVGNHTHHHINGWKSTIKDYCIDVDKASEYIDSNLFRPPYGRMKRGQFDALTKVGMKIIMWTVLSGDYDKRLSSEKIYDRIISGMKAGNIYLFHDSEKAEEHMMNVLERFIENAKSQHFSFSKISI